MTINPEQLKENTKLLYKRVEKFVAKDYYRLFVGFSVVEGFTIIDIGIDQSVHINPKLNQIILVDKKTYHSTNFLSEESVSTLNRLFSEAEIAVESYFYHRPALLKKIDAIFGHNINNSISMYQQAETFTYKMYFTFYISQTCLSEKGVYKFKLADGSFLHLTNIIYYWVDDGDYHLESSDHGIKIYYFEPNNSKMILDAIKELCKKPENLQNLAQPIQKSTFAWKGR